MGLLDNFSKFFSLEMFEHIFTAKGALLILTLVVLEGLLSVDNALTLAARVKPLPEHQRAKALMYGIWGAYFFRFLMIGIGTYLIKFMWIKAVGALYLLYMCIHGLTAKPAEHHDTKPVSAKSFWVTVASIEAMDIVFSIDSVTAALALSDEVWVLLLGSILGILMMRGVAQLFVKLLDKVPELEKTAFVLIGMIGIKLALTLVHVEVPEWLLFTLMFGAFGGTFIINKFNKRKAQVV